MQPRTKLTFDKAYWVGRMKTCSKAAMKGVATRGGCSVTFTENTTYFVNSEGSQLQQSWTTAQLAVSVGVKAEDGEGLSRLEQRFARTPDKLPGDDVVGADRPARADLKNSRPGSARAGPILGGRATVWFHGCSAYIEGHRQDPPRRRAFPPVGKQIMPDVGVTTTRPSAVLNGAASTASTAARRGRAPQRGQPGQGPGVLRASSWAAAPIPEFTPPTATAASSARSRWLGGGQPGGRRRPLDARRQLHKM